MSNSLYLVAKMAAADFLYCAGDEARAEFFAEIEKARKKSLEETFGGKADCRFVDDWSNEAWCCGKQFVYAWATIKGEIFYIGCGDENRVCNIQNRSGEFKEIYRNMPCKVYLIASFVDGDCSKEIETLCIQYAQIRGYALVNKSKMLKNNEIRYFRGLDMGIEISAPAALQEKYEIYKEQKETYKKIISAMDKIICDCMATECV